MFHETGNIDLSRKALFLIWSKKAFHIFSTIPFVPGNRKQWLKQLIFFYKIILDNKLGSSIVVKLNICLEQLILLMDE